MSNFLNGARSLYMCTTECALLAILILTRACLSRAVTYHCGLILCMRAFCLATGPVYIQGLTSTIIRNRM